MVCSVYPQITQIYTEMVYLCKGAQKSTNGFMNPFVLYEP